MPTRHVPAVLSFADNHEEVDAEMIHRGVTVRSVVERAWLECPETAAVLASCVAQGQHISVTDRLPIKLAIVDRRIALLPLDPERETEPVALVVHRTGLLTALVSLFEEHFEKGWRLCVSGTEEDHEAPVAAIDRQIPEWWPPRPAHRCWPHRPGQTTPPRRGRPTQWVSPRR
ncbi:hypothetical protein [Streptomyces sp. NBC_01435]|uniref:hypothetical protein n=1 Tax=Streptomyces sp. NBC_01435 TaxID=2903865 RepID=UPI002E31065E|nr:hypothetical protein [Streptomyces sp. NBC_01435]